jgi:hypothetical protein
MELQPNDELSLRHRLFSRHQQASIFIRVLWHCSGPINTFIHEESRPRFAPSMLEPLVVRRLGGFGTIDLSLLLIHA